MHRESSDPTQKCKGDSLPKKCKRKGNYNELDIDTNQLFTFRNESVSFCRGVWCIKFIEIETWNLLSVNPKTWMKWVEIEWGRKTKKYVTKTKVTERQKNRRLEWVKKIQSFNGIVINKFFFSFHGRRSLLVS